MNYIHKNENAIYYECKYSCDNAIFLSLNGERFFFTDGRYSIPANELVDDCEVIISSDIFKKALDKIKSSLIKKLTIDSKEWNIKEYFQFNEAGLKFDFQENLSQRKRMIKSDLEINLLSEAVQIGANGFDEFALYLSNKGIGKSESELAFKNLALMSKKSKYDISFDAIIALNENSAKPHAHPSNKKAKENDLLLIDAGVKYKRYCSDRTRVCELNGDINLSSNNPVFSNKIKKKVFDIVKKAHDKAIKGIKVGMRGKEIDKIARDVIDKSPYSKYFIHSTGHGVGLDIHELPIISPKSEDIIENNMVFTIEPGIYLPNEFGIRFENMLTIKNDKAYIL